MADITRDYWVEAIQEENVKFVEKIFAALNKETGCDFAPNYTQSYIGASLNGKNSHMINVKQGKKGLRISTQVKQTAAIDSTLKSLAIDGEITYGSDGWYVFFVTNKIDIDTLVSVLKQSAIERGVKPTASKAAAPVAPVAEKPAKEKTANGDFKKCPVCGYKAPNSAAYCSECGADLNYTIKCPMCGARISSKSDFCSECGYELNSGNEKVRTASDKPAKKSMINDPFEGLMVKVCAGIFKKRVTDDDGKAINHKPEMITVKKDFYISKYPVTQGQWKAIKGEGFNPSHFRGDDNLPVENVNYFDCLRFVEKLSELTGKKYRLIDENEWRWAAMGASQDEDQGDWAGCSKVADLDDYAWYKGHSGNKTHPVGQKEPNELGIYDMCGNVREWCGGGWYDYNPVFCGGSWNTDRNGCKIFYRYRPWTQEYKSNDLGFRIALTID